MVLASTSDGAVTFPLDLHAAYGPVATGMTIVTTQDGDGVHGLTADSFTSVSLDPPLVMVSVDNRNRSHGWLGAADRFAVNVLTCEHRSWSERLAGHDGDALHRFDDVGHHLIDGLPALDSAVAVYVCRVVDAHPAGDHTLIIGRVEQIERRGDGNAWLGSSERFWALDACD